MKLDDRGRPIEDGEELDLGKNVLIVDPEPTTRPASLNRPPATLLRRDNHEGHAEHARMDKTINQQFVLCDLCVLRGDRNRIE